MLVFLSFELPSETLDILKGNRKREKMPKECLGLVWTSIISGLGCSLLDPLSTCFSVSHGS